MRDQLKELKATASLDTTQCSGNVRIWWRFLPVSSSASTSCRTSTAMVWAAGSPHPARWNSDECCWILSWVHRRAAARNQDIVSTTHLQQSVHIVITRPSAADCYLGYTMPALKVGLPTAISSGLQVPAVAFQLMKNVLVCLHFQTLIIWLHYRRRITV